MTGPAFGSRVSRVTKNDLCSDLIQNQSSSLVSPPSMKKQKQDTAKHLLNFTYFSKPIAVLRASLESIGAKSIINQSSIEKKGIKSRESAGNSGNPIESTPVIPSSSCQEMEMGANSQPVRVPATDELRLSEAKLFEERNVLVSSCADAFRTNDSENLAWDCRETGSVVASGERGNEPAAASSVCSGNNVEGACDPTHNSKRKRSEDDYLEYYFSEDYEAETECISTATTALGGSGCKRNRDAKVHNSSERKRRERINERMRALQELIPNCNKVDKVSMLDEAIKYLKTFQFQLQMMSMGSGLWMPPLMFPAAMQLMQAPYMPCFSTMTPDKNVLGAQLPGSPIAGASNQQMMAGYNSSMLGTHGPRPPVLMPYLGSISYPTLYPTMPSNASRPGG